MFFISKRIYLFILISNLLPSLFFTAKGEESKVQVEAMLAALPAFSAAWEVEMGWMANPSFAEILKKNHVDVVKNSGFKKGGTGDRALIKSLEEEEGSTRKGYVEKRTMRLDFHTMDRFYVSMSDPRWEGSEETFSSGDGVIYTVDNVNNTVRINKLSRYDLGNLIKGIPMILIYSYSEKNQNYDIQVNGKSKALIETIPLTGIAISKLISANFDSRKNVITEFRRFSRYLSQKGELIEQPSLKYSFFGEIKLQSMNKKFPQLIKTELYRNGKSAMKSTWKLISLERISSKSISPEYKFTKGFTVYDRRSEKTRIFQSDEVLSDKE